MKSNKGYTLVELMVAVAVLLVVMAEVGALMVNSQSLYKNGYYEVSLQENAQQVIQTVQDLLINVNVKDGITHSLSSAGGIDSDVITIKTSERVINSSGAYTGAYADHTYVIGRRIDFDSTATMKTGATGSYTDLMLRVDGGEPVLIAEGVQSIYLTKNNDVDSTADGDMFNYKTADKLSLSVLMTNEQYRYATSTELYLRNKVGTGGDPMPPSGSGSAADVDLTILRIHDYNLRDFVPEEYTSFAFEDSAADTIYDLAADGTSLKCKLILNVNWDWAEEASILATSGSGGVYRIKIQTPAVNDGSRVPIYTWTNTTAGMINAIPVTGICTCPLCADVVTMDAQITLPMHGSNRKLANGAVEDVDLCVYAEGHDFTIKMHYDESSSDPDARHMGDPVPDWYTVANWDNEIFNRVGEGSTMNIKSAWFSVCPMKEKTGITMDHDIWELDATYHQYRVYYYDYLVFGGGNPGDPFAFSNGGQHCVYYPDPNSTGANTLANFEVGRIHVDNKANAFSVNTTQHADAAVKYWDYIVDNDGYVRLHVWCNFKGLPVSSDFKYIYDCYGYFFPQNTGTQAQHDKLMGVITSAVPSTDIQPVRSSSDPEPYDYYN